MSTGLELASIERSLTDVLFEIKVLEKVGVLEEIVHSDYGKRLLLVKEKYLRYGGRNYKYIYPAESYLSYINKLSVLYGRIEQKLSDHYMDCVISSRKLGDDSDSFLDICINTINLGNMTDYQAEFEELIDIADSGNYILSNQKEFLSKEEVASLIQSYYQKKNENRTADQGR